MKKEMQITVPKMPLKDYSKLLAAAQNHIEKTQSNIVKNVTRQKVVLGWELGKLVDEHLAKNNQSGYGESLLQRLAADISISKSSLYQMRNFYKTYPQLPKDDDRLNWTHYQTLSGVKKEDERKRLEEIVRENGWSTNELEQEIKKLKTPNGKGKFAKKNSEANSSKKPQAKLKPVRGQLFSYQLIKISDTKKTYFDLGFGIFREAEEVDSTLQKISAVEVQKKNTKYLPTKSDLPPRKFNTYKAYLERVVDGDTIHVTFDLGFKILHKEIIRLKGIDAPEIGTEAGKKSAKILTKILENTNFLILKTIKSDIYGRFVADVFFDEKNQENDPQKVADEGVYLNQLLLDKGSVQFL